jgi:hypothetical protein
MRRLPHPYCRKGVDKNLMSEEQQFHFDDSGLRNLLMAMESEHYVKIGVFGGDHKEPGEKKLKPNKYGGRKASKQSSGLTNADVGFMLEFGSKLRKQPARSWLIEPIARNIEKIAMETKAFFEKSVTNGDPIMFLKQLGIAAEKYIELAFDEGGPGWAANAPMTVEKKGSDRPGINTGQLRRAVASVVI